MKRIFLILPLLLCCKLMLATAWSAPQVVVSVKPIHSLVAGVMQGVAEPLLLVKGGASPHGYVLRPSEARALSKADLIIWIGHQLESFLEKPLSTLGRNAHQLELSKELAANMLPFRQVGSWERHKHNADGTGGQNQKEYDAERMNPHIWLNPLLAKKIVNHIAAVLSEIDPQNQMKYQKNAQLLHQRLSGLHGDLQARLAPFKETPYLVFHDAYQYFETVYQLNAVGSLTVDPERKPGAKRIREMREKIKTLNARCVFSEPQFEPKLVATIIENTGARTGVLDPLGADLPEGQDSYFQLLNNLADDLITGLR